MGEQIKVKQTAVRGTKVTVDSATEVSKVGIVTVAAFAAVVGLWSLACIVGGMAASGGPLAFVGDWVRAVTGM